MKEVVLAATETGEKASDFKAFGERDVVTGGVAANRG
jgi:hypothetical protein